MVEKILTRKDCINIAEQWVRGAFKGISVSSKETLSRIGVLERDEDELPSDQELFMKREATLREMRDGDALTELMYSLKLTQQQAKVLYLKSFHKVSWQNLEDKFDVDWSKLRKEYENVLHDMFYKARLH